MMSKIHYLLLFIFDILMLTGCLNRFTPPNQSFGLQPTQTLNPISGTVTGRLSMLNSGNITPLKDEILYLAEVISNNEGKSSFASFDRINSPRTTTDAEGRFIFKNVKPGNYGLVIDVITASYLLNKPGTSDPILIEVIGGNVIDLGELIFEDLPIIRK